MPTLPYMTKVHKRGEKVRRFILENVEQHPRDIVAVTRDRFGISRQGVHDHIKKMMAQQAIVGEGGTRNRTYRLGPTMPWSHTYETDGLQESDVYADGIGTKLADLPDNVRALWVVGVTEMVNNAIDHSEGGLVRVTLTRTPTECGVHIADNGIGIFRKIQEALDLSSEQEAFLELAKGKFTTDPDRHTGEGIFFASRMFDTYSILSGEVVWGHKFEYPERDFMFSVDERHAGTTVFMKLENHTSRTPQQVYDMFTSSNDDDDLAFSKTIIPVHLAKYGDEFLVSRSQAKRVLARVDKFQQVILDFEDVDTVGQAFTDEIFRVFHRMHPEVELVVDRANPIVTSMIRRAMAGAAEEPDKP